MKILLPASWLMVWSGGGRGGKKRREKEGLCHLNRDKTHFFHAQHTRVHMAALGEVVLGKCTRNRNHGLPYRQREGGGAAGKKWGGKAAWDSKRWLA